MGFNCSPMIAILTLSFYEIAALRTFRELTLRPDGMRVPTPQGEVNMTPRVRTRLMSFVCRLSRCARAVDDVLFIDLSTTERLWAVKHMYPPELQLKEVCASPDRIFYLDMEILRDRGGFFTTMRIPFGSSVQVTMTAKKPGYFWYIIRGNWEPSTYCVTG